MKAFDEWLPTYLAFRASCAPMMSARVPNEPVGLQKEAQDLEPAYYVAEDYRADAVAYYYQAKLKHIETMHAEGFAVSSLSELAKAKSYKELWAKESTEGLCNAIRDRKIRVAQLLKLQQGPT